MFSISQLEKTVEFNKKYLHVFKKLKKVIHSSKHDISSQKKRVENFNYELFFDSYVNYFHVYDQIYNKCDYC